jgi:hypothetical protein
LAKFGAAPETCECGVVDDFSILPDAGRSPISIDLLPSRPQLRIFAKIGITVPKEFFLTISERMSNGDHTGVALFE